METRNVEKFSILSVQYLLYRIYVEEGIVTPRKNVYYKNNYPLCAIKQILTQVEKQKRNNMNNNNNDDSNTNNENRFMNEKQLLFIILLYKGQQGEKVVKSFKTTLRRALPNNMETKVVYAGTKLGSNFQIKDKTKFNHKHNLVYYVKCLECQEGFIGEIGRRLHEWICDHSGKDRKSHMLKHSLENNHKHVSFEDFCILQNGDTNSKFKQKISEVLFIKKVCPSLNTQETSVPLLLYDDELIMAFYLYLFTIIYKCFYLLFACPNFSYCFPALNHCSIIIQLICADCDAALLLLDS